MIVNESAFLFPCEGDELVGIVAVPAGDCSETGVLVIVGGPQYRVGSHRQFVLLARDLAARGHPCMRFDYRGMGDASGEARTFESVGDDIRAAIDAFVTRPRAPRRVVLWGLCDAATAASFYASGDPRVAGLVLLNPWVRTEAGEAGTYLRHYYLRRLRDPAFWKKLVGGGVAVAGALAGFATAARRTRGGTVEHKGQALPERVAHALVDAEKPFVVVLSGRDYVAREFERAAASGGPWDRLPAARNPVRLFSADHTFSSAAYRNAVAEMTARWLATLEPGFVSPDAQMCRRTG